MVEIATIHLVATAAMFGVIWSVQLVQYPLFARVGPREFTHYHAGHTALIGRVVVPLMLTEAGTATWLAAENPTFPTLASLGLVVAAWAITFLVQVPLHRRLSRAPDPGEVLTLIRSNWLRTVVWSTRVPLACWILVHVISRNRP